MPERKHHIRLEGFYSNESYRSKSTARNPQVQLRNRQQHGSALSLQFANALTDYQHARVIFDAPITDELGIYIELEGFPGTPLPFDNIDNRDFQLRSLTSSEEVEKAVVFIPESRRGAFQNKIEQYLDVSSDRNNKPRNHNMIDSIRSVRLANIRSFWTDSDDKFPRDITQPLWLELWLKKTGQESQSVLAQLSIRLNIEVANSSQTFFDCSVYLIRASISQIESATYLISNLKELRLAKEVPQPIVESVPQEQLEWAEDILSRVSVTQDISTSVLILDAGVNYDNPLLSPFSSFRFSATWDPRWPNYDNAATFGPYQPHGSLQAGIVIYENLLDLALSYDNLEIPFVIESGRILPPRGANDPQLYGDITLGTLGKLEAANPQFNRVYSLAITSEPESLGGQPSSWSAQIDDAAFNFGEDLSRLFIISTGNNREIHTLIDHWQQAELAQIEDPAQAWNALTVGAYTEYTTVNELGFTGWSPFAESGDLAPSTRTSRNWGWIKQAPYKPELVAEGGNRLISPDHTQVSAADCVSLLTTSGKTSIQLFETTRDSSAATALVSNYAAKLMSQYPSLWPETIRGLLVHSAQWSDKMYERFGLLQRDHSPKVAKETMLRTVGFGVPNLERAQFSLANELTLVAENTISPFFKELGASVSEDPKLSTMQLYQLPWPADVLRALPDDIDVKLKVTLSYFIEPNPSRRGYKKRYSYQSHGLRFEVIRPGQPLDNFKAQVNALMVNDDYDQPEGDNGGWQFGTSLRKRGCIHSDVWKGSPQDLADMHTIAICPVGGWWKYRTALDRWQNSVRYSLLISIEVPDSEIDIYSEILNLIENAISIEV